tara:strand:+ start:330 stop:500 length:171 start_codon:yes stop_codon:yes gene_type:complete
MNRINLKIFLKISIILNIRYIKKTKNDHIFLEQEKNNLNKFIKNLKKVDKRNDEIS